MVDGVLNVSFYDARPIAEAPSSFTDAATILPIDAIQEFNLEENPKAEYGWKPGAVVNVGIRSGTNTLHGAAYAFGRDPSFDARNASIRRQTPVESACPTQPTCACDKLPTTLKQFGGVVGGPIKKDKLFFFAGYEGLRSIIGNAIVTAVPETAATTNGDAKNSMVDAITCSAEGRRAGEPGQPEISWVAVTACGDQSLDGRASYEERFPRTPPATLATFPNTNISDNGVAKIDYRINGKHTLNGMFW